uniref:Predicted protein n=1 Tax=Physcomitrium patens TaxID=3218 RepID=A9U097_PHYPA
MRQWRSLPGGCHSPQTSDASSPTAFHRQSQCTFKDCHVSRLHKNRIRPASDARQPMPGDPREPAAPCFLPQDNSQLATGCSRIWWKGGVGRSEAPKVVTEGRLPLGEKHEPWEGNGRIRNPKPPEFGECLVTTIRWEHPIETD